MSEGVVESVAGERIAAVNGIEIAYEEFGYLDGEPLVLIMGLATQMIHWDEEFCGLLGERGYRVVRFDNRDIGHSTKLDEAGMPGNGAMMFGYGKPAYLLSDMATDTVALLDHLGIEDAHVVGASMGGMIAQQLAIDHRQRVRSLCSIMSTTGDRRFRFPRWRAFGPADGETAVEPRGLCRAGGEDVQGDRLARLPDERGAFPRARRARLRPQLPPGGRRPAAARGQLLGQSHPAAAESRSPGARHPWHGRSAGAADRRQGDREGDPRRAAADDRGDGPRPAPRLHRIADEIDSNARRAA